MSKSISSNPEIVGFIALWDESLGPTLEDVYPTTHSLGDIDALAINIFLTFETVFGRSDERFKRTTFVLPLTSIERKAKILLETIPNKGVRGGLQPFVITLLIPENFENLETFDEVIAKIAARYQQNQRPAIRDFYNEIMEIYNRSIQVEEGVVPLEGGYSLTMAVADFKMGVDYFQRKNFNAAYPLLRKTMLKFEQENQQKLVMETVFLLSAIFTQNGRYQIARKYYHQLEELAKVLIHQKYLEQAQFMRAYCAYKAEDYLDAADTLERLNPTTSQFVNPIQYYSLKGRTNLRLERYKSADIALKTALELPEKSGSEPGVIQRQRAQILYELGIIQIRLAIDYMKKKGLSDQSGIQYYLDESIRYCLATAEIQQTLENYKGIIPVYQLIGNVYKSKGDQSKELEFMRKAIEVADQIRDLRIKLKLIIRIVQIQKNLHMYSQNVIDLQQIITDLNEIGYIDIFTHSIFHQQLGENLEALEQIDEALREYFAALNLYHKLKTPVTDELNLLDKIQQIFEFKHDQEKKIYYQEQRDRLETQLNQLPKKSPLKTYFLGEVKELWIFFNTGLELFSHAPQTQFDPELLGGFLSAIQSFSLELSKHTLNSMVIGDDRYVIYREPNSAIYIMGRAKTRSPELTVEKTLKQIYQQFNNKFGKDLDNFVGNVAPFKEFQEELNHMNFDTL